MITRVVSMMAVACLAWTWLIPTHTAAPTSQPADLGRVPIGSIVAWHKALTGEDKPPRGWQACDGSDITEGPLAGKKAPDLNSSATNRDGGRFLRGNATSGIVQEANVGQHTHTVPAKDRPYVVEHEHGNERLTRASLTDKRAFIVMTEYRTGHNGVPSLEARPDNMSVVWILRIQ
ncbi:MAG: hypothetical protein GY842_21070 [bacterium]|nr:hypothetical protein [bacterium]